LLVKCHGGPTGAASAALDLKIQFWTSRGFAVLDVNYRGSTGYGRRYRRALYGRWGLADVEDCAAGAQHVCELGEADPHRLLISGGSAGGYTVLCALAFTDVFLAGASYYGIGDLEALFATTHKFESHYDHLLIGPDRAAVRDRSPLHHAESVGCPVIFFQGGMDKVVPPAQSRSMHEALVRQGLATAYLEFPDEAHGFRRAANIQRALECELAFYARILGLDVPVAAPDLEIRNASGLPGPTPAA
jgi:dipeptidyl aminopeptidase/acylaminoacyl peptidase